MLERKFVLTANLEARIGDTKMIGDAGGDLFLIPGKFSHPMHGPFEMGFIGEPPKLLIRHNATGRVGLVHIDVILATLAQEMVKKLQ